MTSPVSAIDAIEKAMEGVTPGPWEVYDGCSWRRIGTVGRNYHDCAVLAPTVASDGHPDLTCAPGNDLYANLAYIAACNPAAMREVLALARQAEALQRENAELRSVAVVASEALCPFAASVFNDNGDMSVDLSPASGDDYIRAYFADRRARALLGGENAE